MLRGEAGGRGRSVWGVGEGERDGGRECEPHRRDRDGESPAGGHAGDPCGGAARRRQGYVAIALRVVVHCSTAHLPRPNSQQPRLRVSGSVRPFLAVGIRARGGGELSATVVGGGCLRGQVSWSRCSIRTSTRSGSTAASLSRRWRGLYGHRRHTRGLGACPPECCRYSGSFARSLALARRAQGTLAWLTRCIAPGCTAAPQLRRCGPCGQVRQLVRDHHVSEAPFRSCLPCRPASSARCEPHCARRRRPPD